MKVVSSQTEEQVAARQALRALSWPLRELTANLMRLLRGGKSGKAHELNEQLIDALATMQNYVTVAGCLPSRDEVLSILDLDFGRDDPFAHWRDFEFAEREVVKGALRVAAASLVGPANQRSRGQEELHDGVAALERIRERNRRKAPRSRTRRKRGSGRVADDMTFDEQ